MERYKITIVVACMAFALSGCIYDSHFTCEGFKNAGRACQPATSNIEEAVKNDGNTHTESSAYSEDKKDTEDKKEKIGDQKLFIKCATTEDCTYKEAPKDLVFLNDEAKTYLDYKKSENDIRADELTKYSINIKTDNTPVTTKPKTLRVTILPYLDDKGRLNMIKRVYLILERSEWVLGDYLVVDDKSVRAKE